jgi:hypothetical protein
MRKNNFNNDGFVRIDLFIWTRKSILIGQQTLGNSTVNDESAKSNDTYNVLSHVGAGVIILILSSA